jgi:hypothetical protein
VIKPLPGNDIIVRKSCGYDRKSHIVGGHGLVSEQSADYFKSNRQDESHNAGHKRAHHDASSGEMGQSTQFLRSFWLLVERSLCMVNSYGNGPSWSRWLHAVNHPQDHKGKCHNPQGPHGGSCGCQ